MAVIVSPGVYATEKDFSLYAPALATSICGMIGTASKGPVNSLTLITDEGSMVETFGPPSANHLGVYAALRYLKKGRQLKFVRVAEYDATSVGIIRNVADTLDALTVSATSSGSWGNRISVLVSAGTDAGTYRIAVTYGGATVESYNLVSLTPGGANYVEDRINSVSSYITVSHDVAATDLATGYTDLTGGVDGAPVSATTIIGNAGAPPTIPATGLHLFANPETEDVNLLCVPGRSEASIIAAVQSICESRGDCFGLIDPPYGLTVKQVVAWHNGTSGLPDSPAAALNSSYLAVYYPWLRVYDGFNDLEVWVPPSGYIAGVCAYTDYVADPWWAPAGLSRAMLSDVLAVEHSPSQGDRDYMYASGNAVNPIVNYAGQGIVVWGQRTLQRAPTALDRINVRRMMLYLRKVVATATRYLVMEPNDDTTWTMFHGLVSPLCDAIKSRRGLYDFRVICDETTNTPDVIDRNEMRGRILLKPTKTAEIISLEFTLLPTGASFTEV